MIDAGLLVAVVVVVVGLQWFARVSPPSLLDRAELVELWVGPILLGLAVARVVFVAFDDASSLTRLRDLLVLRSGLEFWAGAATAAAAAGWKARRLQQGVLPVFAASIPFMLFGVALYEGSCVVRDGCFGPPSRVGLMPPGLDQRLFPVGIFVAVTLLVAGATLKRLWTMSSAFAVVIGGLVLAATRAVASRHLPSIGPSRIQLESDLVAVTFAVALVVLSIRWVRHERRRDALVNTVATTRASELGEGR